MFTLDIILILAVWIIAVLTFIVTYLLVCETGKSAPAWTVQDAQENTLEQDWITLSGEIILPWDWTYPPTGDKCGSILPLPFQVYLKSKTSNNWQTNLE